MNNENPDTDKIDLDTVIDAALIELSGFTADSSEYKTILDRLQTLYTIKVASDKASFDNMRTIHDIETGSKEPTKKGVSPDTLVSAGASLAGIFMILSYEHVAPITSKALSFVTKAKI